MGVPLASIYLAGEQHGSCYLSQSTRSGRKIELAFREAALTERNFLLVNDTSKDSRFPKQRAGFVAAAPLWKHDGSRLGTLTIYDFAPRSFTSSQKKDLQHFAKLVSSQLECLSSISLGAAVEKSKFNAGEVYYAQDLEGKIVEANTHFEMATGYPRSSLIGMKCKDLLLPESAEAMQQLFVSILGGEAAQPIRLTFLHKQGQPVTLEARLRLHFGMGKPASLLCVARSLTENIRTEAGLQEIAEAISSVTGDEFFMTLAGNLTRALGVKYAIIGEKITTPPARIRTLAAYNYGESMRNFEYDLEGTPCACVAEGNARCYPAGTSALFSDDPVLAEMGIESYMGLPLRASGGAVIGVLAIMDTVEWAPTSRAEAALRLFAMRAAAELERRNTERDHMQRQIAAHQSLLEAERQYLATISNTAEGMILRLAEGRVAVCNHSGRRILGVAADTELEHLHFKQWKWFREDGRALELAEHPSSLAMLGSDSQKDVVLGVDRPDGVRVWLSISAVPLVRHGETKPYAVITSFSDITQQREFHAGLKQLHRLTSTSYSHKEDLYRDFIRTGCEMFGLPHGYLSRSDGETISLISTVSELHGFEAGLRIPYDDSFCREVMEEGLTVAVEDTELEKRFRMPPLFHQFAVRSYFGTSVTLADNVRGVIGFFGCEPKPAGHYNAQRQEILELMSRSLGRVLIEEQSRAGITKAEEHLRRSEHLFRSIIETTSDFVCIFDRQRKLTYISPSIIRAFELPDERAYEVSVPDFVAQGSIRDLVRQEKVWLSSEGPHPPFETTFKKRDGTRICVECIATNLLSDPEIRGIVVSGRDISERKMAQLLERDRNRVLEMVARSEPAHDVFRRIAGMFERQQPGARAAILLLRRGQLFWECAPGFPGEHVAAFPRIAVSPDAGSYALAAHARELVIASDTRTDPFWRARKKLAKELGIGTCMAMPILSAFGQVLGVFAAHFEAGFRIEERHRTLMQTAVSIAAISMEHNLLTDQLSYQSQHDALTGLPNRLQLQDRLPLAIEDARSQGKLLAVCFIDLDRFKQINDTLGHTTGDRLLEQVSRRLKHCSRPGGLLARMGGDEFTIVLSGLNGLDEARLQAEDLLGCLRAPFDVDGHELFITGSMGISMFPRDGRDVASLLRNADSAMYMAKHKGNDSLEFFKPGLGAIALRNLEMETYLRRAIDNNELRLLYQPQVDLDGRVESLEALVKWDHPKLGRISPSQFIPIAEESGMIVQIGAWVLRQACKQNAAWQAAGLRPIRVSVNVSAMQFAKTDFVETVEQALLAAGLEPRYLDLELTESILVENIHESAARMSTLREVGVSISIDDFGTGYSSLSYLRRLPADTLKIDQSFLRESKADTGSLAVIQTIVSLAHNLGLTVVAEGVETSAQLDLIRMAGCDKAQGHFFGEAITPDEVPQLLRDLRTH